MGHCTASHRAGEGPVRWGVRGMPSSSEVSLPGKERGQDGRTRGQRDVEDTGSQPMGAADSCRNRRASRLHMEHRKQH